MAAYLASLGLTGRPFRLEPDIALNFDSRAQRAALRRLMTLLAQGARLAALVGEAGAGKTMLARLVQATLEQSGVDVLHLRGDRLASSDLAPLRQWRRGRLLVLIDEAHRLAPRRLSRLVALADAPGLHTLLVGRPQLLDLLAEARGKAITMAAREVIRLEAMGSREIAGYVEHRLRAVGWKGDRILDDAAADRLYLATRGLPRRIGRICSRGLALAAIDGEGVLSERQIDAAVADLAPGVLVGHHRASGARQSRHQAGRQAGLRG